MGTEIQVRAMYDFDGVADNGELSIRANEILTVTRQDIGDGWWEGRNVQGEVGFFPEAYVETLPSVPQPPAIPARNQSSYGSSGVGGQASSWDNSSYNQQQYPKTTYSSSYSYGQTATDGGGEQAYNFSNSQDDDGWDEDWDDDTSSNYSDRRASQQDPDELTGDGVFGLSVPNRQQPRKPSSHSQSSSADAKGSGTIRKSLNRFTVFVKSGGENYMLGSAKATVDPRDRMEVVETPDGIQWGKSPEVFSVEIKNPTKATKLKGMKSFIAYEVTPTHTNRSVTRRYKHFDWLYNRLVEKFSVIAIPPLPDKQVTGRYEEEFIQHRMAQLQLWMNRMTRHSIVSRADVFQHFLSCGDDKNTWKAGKRRAEKDNLIGGSFFLAIETPSTPLDMQDVEQQLDNFGKFVKSMDDSVKTVYNTAHDSSKKHVGPYKREFQKVGAAFNALSTSFELDNTPKSRPLTEAIAFTGRAYDEIGLLFSEQPKNDLHPFMDALHEYRGIIPTFPDILQVHKGAMGKFRECQKLQEEGKMEASEVEGVQQRLETISYATLAEMNHFHKERIGDVKVMMQNYLQQQIAFYQQVTSKLQEALIQYDNV
ncbi:SNX33 [Branchiostoma lanceolatum]|uniref:Sorting nexin n=1 Tax=Branchiostoma lanceolatum TaxID=7740 RepID=A0A8J9ZEB7_BRALA|nr:SNX33 [Branchiostoma lanceolatum]